MHHFQNYTQANRSNKEDRSASKLSNRKLEVLYLTTYEYTNQEIADKLFLSKGTIASYRNNIVAKFKSKNTAGIMRSAFESGSLLLIESGKIVTSSVHSFRRNSVTHYRNNVVHHI